MHFLPRGWSGVTAYVCRFFSYGLLLLLLLLFSRVLDLIGVGSFFAEAAAGYNHLASYTLGDGKGNKL